MWSGVGKVDMEGGDREAAGKGDVNGRYGVG